MVPTPSSQRDSDPEARWLCSHLVELSFLGDRSLSETGLLEEIGATQAWVAVETAYPMGSHVDFTAQGFQVSAEVVVCRARENDYRIKLEFQAGRLWSPEVWEPDHLFRPPSKKSKAKGNRAAAG